MDERRNLGSRLVNALTQAGLSREVIERFCDALESLAPQTPCSPDTPLDLAAFSAVVKRVCERLGLITQGVVQVLTREELEVPRELGHKRADEVYDFIASRGLRLRRPEEDFLQRAEYIYGDALRVPVAAVVIHVLSSCEKEMTDYAAAKGWKTLGDLCQASFDELSAPDFLGERNADRLILWLQTHRLHPAA